MRRYFLPLATVILLVAAVLRLCQLHQYPPGPHYDEGAYLLITRSIAFGGARFFPIVEAYQGREVLYMYLNAPLLHLFGDRIYTLHLTSAFLNLLTIAAAIRLGRAMFRGERGIIVALAIGVIAAISFPQIFIARQAFRAVTLPFMQAFALLFLWRGLTMKHGWLWLALGGLFAGGAIYTYMASRLFALWLALGALVLLWADRARWRRRLSQGALVFGIMFVTMLPMIVYALQKPDIFWGRLGEVTQSAQSISLVESILLHLRMFFIEGDPYLRYNIPSRPYFTLPEGALLLIGIAICIWRLRAPNIAPLERSAYALALLSPLMVIPSVISVGGLPPSHMRSLGMIPLIFVLVAIGFEAVWQWSKTRLPLLQSPRALPAALLAVLLIGGISIGQVYFDWAGRADLFYETDADLSLAARWLLDNTPPGTQVYLAARDRSHPTVLIEQTPPITWIGTNTLFRPPAGENGLYVFPRSAPPPPDWLAWLEPGRMADLPLAPDGRTAFEAFRLSATTTLPQVRVPDELTRNPYMTLIGSYAEPMAAGTRSELIALWTIDAPPPVSDLTPLVLVEDRTGWILSGADVYMTETDRWQAGSVLFIRLPVSIPHGTAPGRYAVRVAWVARGEDRYQAYTSYAGTQAGVWATIGTVEVVRPTVLPSPEDIPIQRRLDIAISDGLRLVGHNALPASVRPGETLHTRFVWQALRDTPARTPYRVLLRGQEQETMLWTGEPSSDYPTSAWIAGEIITEAGGWVIDRRQASGDYEIVLAWQGGELSLGTLRIEGVARVFEQPESAVDVDATFADIILLDGYTLSREAATVRLTLVWQSLVITPQDYTVFVHAVNTGSDIVAQYDRMPVNNAYPTHLWLPGEFVIDNYVFENLVLDSLTFRVGLYDQTTGQRLQLRYDQGLRGADFFEIADS
jgi:4-amino-4-deoxy-L-arabinose transferase-like glycosyltransferase